MSAPLLTLDNITVNLGTRVLLDHLQLKLHENERICLIGPNGAGKSTLLKIIANEQTPDYGEKWQKPGLLVARLEQELPFNHDKITVYQWVAQGLAHMGELLHEHHELSLKISQHANEQDLQCLANLQQELDTLNAWRYQQYIESTLQYLGLNPDMLLADLSGGWLRRVTLAKALVCKPDVLLLDEPTNHLDIEAIQWLENELMNFSGAILFITHDRALLQRLATRIIELDRGRLISWPGDYSNFLRRKAELLAAEAKADLEFDKKLAAEEQWIRQGIKARRTRNEGRVRSLEAMRKERELRRTAAQKAKFSIDDQHKSGDLVVDAEKVHYQIDGKYLVRNLSLRIMRGDRIGLVGPNGIGKSTLLNLLLGHIKPQSGRIKLGTRLEIAYFDQLRQNIDPEKSVLDNISNGREAIQLGKETIHIMGYLGHFLFTPERARTPVKALSGGECNRVVLADLFSRPSNLLVLDEPTNDLDMETLELLEELLLQYQGTLLLVSHDRAFLENVVTSLLIFEEDGKIIEYIGGYENWQKNSQRTKKFDINKNLTVNIEKQSRILERKLNSQQKRELEQIPKRIEKLEKEQFELTEQMAEAGFYQQNPDLVSKITKKYQTLTQEINDLYAKWEELER